MIQILNFRSLCGLGSEAYTSLSRRQASSLRSRTRNGDFGSYGRIIVHNADNVNYVHAHEYVYFECACICAHCHASEESVYAVELFFFAPPSKGMYMEPPSESIRHFLWMKYANSFPRVCREDMQQKESTNCRQKMECLQRNYLYRLPSLYIIPFIDMFVLVYVLPSLSYDDSDDLTPPDSVIVVDRRHAAAPICGIFGDTYIPCNIHDEGIHVCWE